MRSSVYQGKADMDNDFNEEGFEGFLREKSDQYKLYPSDRVWHGIQRELHPRKKWPGLVALILLVGFGLGTTYYLNEEGRRNLSLQTTPSNTEKDWQVISRNYISPIQVKPFAEAWRTSPTPTQKISTQISEASQKHNNKDLKVASSRSKGETISASPQPTSSDMISGYAPTLSPEIAEVGHHTEKSSWSPNMRIDLKARSQAMPEKAIPSVKEEQYTMAPVLPVNSFKPHAKKLNWEMYVTPSVSYRRLIGKASNANYPSINSIAYSANFGYPSDVNAAVIHRPSVGMEIGTAIIYPLNRFLKLKAGIQLNYNQYMIQAYNYVPELASYGANSYGYSSTPINQVSYYRNFNGYSKTWLSNQHFMVSLPLGFELNLLGREEKVQFGVASTIQPTYMLNDNAYLISTNLKNYAEAPALYRNWNVNGAVEAYLSVNTGSVKWIVGPQFRYQMLSSYTDNYPIREHLVDYGFKLGIKKTIR